MLLLSLVTACTTEDEAAQEPSQVERGPDIPIVIAAGAPVALGVSAPTTGPDAQLGTEDRNAVVAAVERWKEDNGSTIGGHAIEVAVEDDG